MLRRKRKSNPKVDEVEDGARAIITEEAISLLVFKYAQEKRLFIEAEEINPLVLETIATMVKDFEVQTRSLDEWKTAIVMGYRVFSKVVRARKGKVLVDMINRKISYSGH